VINRTSIFQPQLPGYFQFSQLIRPVSIVRTDTGPIQPYVNIKNRPL
jgi:hypothetical protein